MISVREIDRSLEQWQMEVKDLRRRMIWAPTPRERWYAILLLAQGWRASATATALERDPHTIGRWAAAFGEGGPRALIFEQNRWSPPAPWRGAAGGVEGGGAAAACRGGHGPGQLELEGGASVLSGNASASACVPQQLPDLPPSTRGQALRRLGFAFKRPKKRLLKADEEKREEAAGSGAKIFFADEAHFRADAELRGRWVLRGEPAPAHHALLATALLAISTRAGGSLVHISALVISRASTGISLFECGSHCQHGVFQGHGPQEVFCFPILSEGHRCGELLPLQPKSTVLPLVRSTRLPSASSAV